MYIAIHVIFKKKKELIKSVKKYLLYEILCKELASQSVSLTHSLTHSVARAAGPRFFDSLPNNGLTRVFKVSLTV